MGRKTEKEANAVLSFAIGFAITVGLCMMLWAVIIN